MITYKGLPAPIVCDYLSRVESRGRYAHGTEFQIGRIDMVANTGTYVDAPFHRYADGKDLSELALESLANLDCVVIRAIERRERAVGSIAANIEVRGKAVLFHTGWDTHWRTTNTSKAIRISPARLPSASSMPARRSSASIRSTSTARRPANARCTRSCSAPRYRSSNTCAGSTRCRTAARAFTRCRSKSKGWAPFPCVRSPGSERRAYRRSSTFVTSLIFCLPPASGMCWFRSSQ